MTKSEPLSQCNDRKSCCQCCQIGRRQYSESGGCDGSITLPEPCKSAYLACCVPSVDTSVPVVQVPSKPTAATTTLTTTTRPTTPTTTKFHYITPRRSLCKQFGETLCDQVCIDVDGGRFTCECYEGYQRKNDKCVRERVCFMKN